MTDYRYHRKTMVEQIGRQMVDVTLARLIRFHASSDQDQADLLSLLSHDITYRQLELMLPRFDARQPVQATSITINRYGDGEWGDGPTLTAIIELDGKKYTWIEAKILAQQTSLPQVIADSLVGEPLERLITHPYLPPDLPISSLSLTDAGWLAYFR